jgi:hypothetical protein
VSALIICFVWFQLLLKVLNHIMHMCIYEVRLRSSWTHLITPSRKCGGAVTDSFSKHFHWKAMHFLQRSIHFSKTCCRSLLTSKFLASALFMFGKAQKSHGPISGLYGGCSNGVPPIHFFQAEHRIQSRNADAPVRKYLVAPSS